MKTYSKKELDNILKLHKKWLNGDKDGVRANLSYADLSNANLSKADFFEADLSYADLSKADLSYTSIYSFTLGNHYGYAWKRDKEVVIKIGCEEHSLTDWLNNYKKIGEKNKYTEQEIKRYLDMLKLLKKWK